MRALKDVGWSGFSVDTALTPLANMAQVLFDPPDVSGWDAGTTWFTTGAMLARMNFASTLAGNQKFNLAANVKIAGVSRSPDAMLAYFLDQIATAPLDSGVSGSCRTTCARPGRGPAPTRSCRRSHPVWCICSQARRNISSAEHMEITRRQFVKGGVAAFTVTFAAPEFLSDLARAQGLHTRNLVVLYLGGGNDSLSMLVPYSDPAYTAAARRLPFPRVRCCRSAATRLASRWVCIRGSPD